MLTGCRETFSPCRRLGNVKPSLRFQWQARVQSHQSSLRELNSLNILAEHRWPQNNATRKSSTPTDDGFPTAAQKGFPSPCHPQSIHSRPSGDPWTSTIKESFACNWLGDMNGYSGEGPYPSFCKGSSTVKPSCDALLQSDRWFMKLEGVWLEGWCPLTHGMVTLKSTVPFIKGSQWRSTSAQFSAAKKMWSMCRWVTVWWETRWVTSRGRDMQKCSDISFVF